MLAPYLALYEQISLPVAGLCTVTFFPVTFFPSCPCFFFTCHFIHTATQMNGYLFSCFFFSHLSTVTFFPVTFFLPESVTFFPVSFFPTCPLLLSFLLLFFLLLFFLPETVTFFPVTFFPVTFFPCTNLSTTPYDLTPTGQRGKLHEKIFFTFDFHILPEHRRIGDKIFPCRCISIKNGDQP